MALASRISVLPLFAFAATLQLLSACDDSVKLEEFLQDSSTSFKIEHNFGQLLSTGPTEVAHYMQVLLDPASTSVFAPTGGEVVFDDDLDGLLNCVIIKPTLRDDEGATPLENMGPGLADADEIRIALCNLDNSGTPSPLKLAMQALYTDAGAADPADKATRFLNVSLEPDERLGNVWAAPDAEFPDPPDDSEKKRWSRLGPAASGRLQIVVFSEEEDHKTYHNPAAYLARIPLSPPASAQRRPTMAELKLERAADAAFSTSLSMFDFNLTTGAITPSVDLDGFLRVFFRLTNNSDDTGSSAVVSPYQVDYRLRQMSGSGPIVRSQGKYYLNSLATSASATLAQQRQRLGDALYRTPGVTVPVSAPATEELWIQLPIDTRIVSAGDIAPEHNIGELDFDLALQADVRDAGVRRYPPGDYELEISLFDAFNELVSQTQVVSFTIGGTSLEIHPVDADFSPGNQGRVLISTLHDASYHTTAITTAANGSAQSEPAPPNVNENKVTISVYVQPQAAGQTVFFEVIDPDDRSDNGNGSYVEDQTPTTPFMTAGDAAGAVDSDGNDNRDPAKTMAGGTLAAYNAFQAATLSTRSAVTSLVNINGVQQAVAEVTLTITDKYAGDNYQVRATVIDPTGRPFNDNSGVTADLSADADIATGDIVSTSVLTAWKRVYLETDTMFRVGADLTVDSGAAAAAPNEIRVATAGLGLAAGDQVQVFDTDDQLAPFGETKIVQSVAADRIVLTTNLIGNYQVARRAHVGKATDASNAGFVAFYQPNTSQIASLFREAFVEVVSRAQGSGPTPHQTALAVNAGEAAYANRWFHLPAANRKNYFHIIGAHTASDSAFGGAPVPNHPTNAAITYVQQMETDFAAGDVPNINQNTTSHELTHHFDDNPAPPQNHDDPAQAGVVPASGDVCIMSRVRDRRLPVKWGTFHVYTVRDETDGQ